MRAISDFDLESLAAELAGASLVPSHARKLLRNFYDHAGLLDYNDLNVGKRVEAFLRENIVERQSRIVHRTTSSDGTIKLLIGFDRGGTAETVLMPSHRPGRAAGCVSSQIGCAMGCDFCASTQGGLERNLTAGEIVEQFLHLKAEAAGLGRRLTSIVFMGMGEPMHNLPEVVRAIKRMAATETGALGWRQITVSTVGIVPGINALARADLNVHLALSLHAPDDETRAMLVPMNRRFKVAQIMDAAKRFAADTGRVPTIEYCMLSNVNDSVEHAQKLAALMEGFRAHVNLIPYNATGRGASGQAYQRSTPQRIQEFLAILRAAGVVAHTRNTRGDDVNAACGQLRQSALNS